MITHSPLAPRSPARAQRRKVLLVAKRHGRLGNQLFLFSHLITCAMETGHTVIHAAFHNYARHFEGTCNDPLCRFPAVHARLSYPLTSLLGVRPVRRLFEVLSLRCAPYAPGVRSHLRRMSCNDENYQMDSSAFERDAGGASVVVLHEWTWRYSSRVENYYPLIRQHFTPVAKHRRAIDAAVGKARDGADVLIGVHIRQGDFRDWWGGKYYQAADKFSIAMQRLEKLLPGRKVRFLVCSDEPLQRAQFGSLDVHFGHGGLVEDLYSLARCDYLIGTNASSYSAWASFYGETPLWRLNAETDFEQLEDFRVFPLTENP